MNGCVDFHVAAVHAYLPPPPTTARRVSCSCVCHIVLGRNARAWCWSAARELWRFQGCGKPRVDLVRCSLLGGRSVNGIQREKREGRGGQRVVYVQDRSKGIYQDQSSGNEARKEVGSTYSLLHAAVAVFFCHLVWTSLFVLSWIM